MSFERDPDGNWCGVGARQWEAYETAASPGAIAETFAPNCQGELLAVFCHMADSGNAADTLKLTFDAHDGAKHDMEIYDFSMSGVKDHWKTFDPPLPFDRGDEIDVAHNNVGTKAIGVRLAWRKVG